MTRILIVEDDIDIRGLLARGLEAEGFEVGTAANVDDALKAARDPAPGAVLLDVGLPDGSGHDVCRFLREGGFSGPILFLSARDEIRDRAEGLAIGADDYIVKPFEFDELVARLRTHLMRRQQAEAPRSRLVAGRLMFDLDTRQVSCGEASARLTPREAELLAMLMESLGKPVSRAEIFDRLWASQGGLSLNVVDVYIGYLRSKMSDFVRYGGPVLTTVRGKGFMLEPRGPDFRQ
jgi:DNA-binding response OmpR family regulator